VADEHNDVLTNPLTQRTSPSPCTRPEHTIRETTANALHRHFEARAGPHGFIRIIQLAEGPRTDSHAQKSHQVYLFLFYLSIHLSICNSLSLE